MLDPAGGTGGFCTATIRHMRSTIRESHAVDAVKRRRMEQIKDRIFYIDVKHRLVKIAKAAMILTGNGHRGFTQGDSLASFDHLPSELTDRAQPGNVDRVLTNPPFAGTSNGKIDAPAEMTPQFELARRWMWQGGKYAPTMEALPGGVPPELLFIERCIQWLKPGGWMGIVVPKGVLENPDTTLAARHFMFRHCYVRAVVALHKNTFQPYTGTRTALLVLQKKAIEQLATEGEDYAIFMAVSRKIGQDSEGVPVFVKDDHGDETEQADHDLDDIFDAWRDHTSGQLQPSEYAFAVNRSSLDERSLICSPQSFLPSLNEAIATVLRLGETDKFTVTPLSLLPASVYKGTRFKREDLEVENEIGADTVRYYTPSALLQDRADSIKYLDLGRADPKRRAEIERHRLRHLELLVTRSGTIGRVILVTADQAGHTATDDLIRIEIADESVRAYVYQFLKSDLGQKQMKRNEYGTIQQHLEPTHIRAVLIPLPNDPNDVTAVAQLVLRAIESKEQSMEAERQAASTLQVLNSQTGDAYDNQPDSGA
jgi:type I restriction enzyme M protein